jgi:serine/threonine protein kinase
MMIVDNDIVIVSDGKPFVTVDADSEGQIRTVGPYIVQQRLGTGGFSKVYVGSNSITNQKVALKFISKSDIHNITDAERTASEYRVLSSLNHPNIIKLVSVS